MRVDEVPLEPRFMNLYEASGIKELYPPQKDLVGSGALEKKNNIILCTPTASGKTFAAEMLMAKALSEGRRAVYVVPLRALAYEKYTEFKRYESLGFSVRLEMGDMDSSKYRKKLDFDILVTTAEKCDSILRSRPEWFSETGILVMDEVHLIASDRGPVYEIIISKLQMLYGDMRVLALSATIGNASEFAEWLNADLLLSDWRPVPLTEEVVVGKDKYVAVKEAAANSIAGGGQVLVFVNSRRSAESVAEKLGRDLKLPEAPGVGKEILSVLSSPTSQCRRLASCTASGTAFHHAGITNEQRIMIEDAFKAGKIKVIVATPTLAAGVNLPSRTVIVRDVQRYEEEGAGYIPVLEYKQQVGRAGRPTYDRFGQAVLVAKNESEKEYFTEKYLHGEIESIFSRLGVEPVLRFHILAAVASGFTRTEKALLEFFRSTFFGFQYGLEGFEARIDKLLGKLEEWGFIQRQDGFLLATELGRRVSELYIDPLTARNYIRLMEVAEKEKRFPALGLLEMLCDAAEMRLLYLKRQEEQNLWTIAYRKSEELFRDLDGFDLDARFLERFKTARLFELWVEETAEDAILEHYGVAPGTLYQKVKVAEWLIYSAAEIASLVGLKEAEKHARRLESRIKYGVKDELIPLVNIKGIGRVRARKLFSAGIKTPADLRKTELLRLKFLVGEKTAEKIKEELK